MLYGLKRIPDSFVVGIAQQVDRARTEVQTTLPVCDERYTLTAFRKSDSTSQAAKTSTYYYRIVFHFAIFFSLVVRWSSPHSPS